MRKINLKIYLHTLWRNTSNRRYSSTLFNLGIRWRWMASFTVPLLCLLKRFPGIYLIGGAWTPESDRRSTGEKKFPVPVGNLITNCYLCA